MECERPVLSARGTCRFAKSRLRPDTSQRGNYQVRASTAGPGRVRNPDASSSASGPDRVGECPRDGASGREKRASFQEDFTLPGRLPPSAGLPERAPRRRADRLRAGLGGAARGPVGGPLGEGGRGRFWRLTAGVRFDTTTNARGVGRRAICQAKRTFHTLFTAPKRDARSSRHAPRWSTKTPLTQNEPYKTALAQSRKEMSGRVRSAEVDYASATRATASNSTCITPALVEALITQLRESTCLDWQKSAPAARRPRLPVVHSSASRIHHQDCGSLAYHCRKSEVKHSRKRLETFQFPNILPDALQTS